MINRKRTLDTYWADFLRYLKEGKDDEALMSLIISCSLEDISWMWFADNHVHDPKEQT